MNLENYEMLIANIEMLMRNHGINQTRLIEATSIPQSQMSKCLNRTNKAQLTLEQIWKIADYFNVSIDFLVGRKITVSGTGQPSITAICRQLMQLIESDTIQWKEITGMDNAIFPPENHDNKTKNTYTAFYFSNYVSPHSLDLSKLSLIDFIDGRGVPNTFNQKINESISYFIKLYDLFQKNNLPRNIFDTAITDRLKSL